MFSLVNSILIAAELFTASFHDDIKWMVTTSHGIFSFGSRVHKLMIIFIYDMTTKGRAFTNRKITLIT